MHATAPCGHNVNVPNEAYDERVRTTCEKGCAWSMRVIEVDGIPSVDWVVPEPKPPADDGPPL